MPSDAVVRDRLKQARQWVRKYRYIWSIPRRWKITVEQNTTTGPFPYKAVVYCDDPKARIVIGTWLLKSTKSWDRLGERTIAHEVAHILMNPYDRFVEQELPSRHVLKAGQLSERIVEQLETATKRILAA